MKDGDGRLQGELLWKQLYEAALLELDPKPLLQRIADAQKGDWRTGNGAAPRKRAQPFRDGSFGKRPRCIE